MAAIACDWSPARRVPARSQQRSIGCCDATGVNRELSARIHAIRVEPGVTGPMRRTVSDPSPHMPHMPLATLILLSLSAFINYIDGGNLATAAALIKQEPGLSATQLGCLRTAFFIVYVPMRIVVGWLADRCAAARILLGGFMVWSLAMSLTGLAHGIVMLVVLRLLLGLAESVSFPATSSIIARCFPGSRCGIANAVTMIDMAYDPAAGIFSGMLLIAAFGWRLFFVGWGSCSCSGSSRGW